VILRCQHPAQRSSQDTNVLTCQAQEDALIIYEGQDWSNYALNVAVKSGSSPTSEQAIDICFGVKDPDQHYFLRILPVEDDTAKLEILRRSRGFLEPIAAAHSLWRPDQWHKIEVAHANGSISASIDSSKAISTATEQVITGGIGFGLQASAPASFDNIHVRLISDSSTEEVAQ